MPENFTMPIPSPVQFVIDRLERAGYHAYCVGGCVRDSIMEITPKDYDVTTSAKPDEMVQVFSDCRVVETGLKHGTLTVVREGMNIEVTTYRIDGTYDDGRHPDSVTFTDKLSDDLCRRDFTINAMAYSPERGLVDLYGGCDDIEKKTVRCVGRAVERYSEDGLRILRALRFASVLDFTLEAECAQAVRSMKHLLNKISRERIYVELTKLISGAGASRILGDFPEVIAYPLGVADETIKKGAETVAADERYGGGENPALRYASLLDSLSESDGKAVFATLKPSREEARAVERFLKYREATDFDEYSILKLMGKTTDGFPPELVRFRLVSGRMSEADAASATKLCQKLISENRPRRVSDLEINGGDLLGLGLSGRAVGETLERLLDDVIRGEVENDKEKLIKRVMMCSAQL